MKKKAIVLVLGALIIGSATCFHVFAGLPGPPPGPPPHGHGFIGGPLGPPPGPPPHGGGFIGGPPGPPPLGLLGGPPDLIEKLKLTEDQLKQMRMASVEFQNKSRKARIALMGLHDEKRTMLMSGKIDQARLAKLDEEITDLASEVMAEDLKMKRDQLSKLTPEQVNLLASPWARKRLPADEKTTAK